MVKEIWCPMESGNSGSKGPIEQAQLDFLSTLVRSISVALDLEFVFLAFPSSKPGEPVTRVQALAVASWGVLCPSFEYDLSEGPCRLLYEGLETFIPCDVALQFPIDPTFGWNGYVGIPIRGSGGDVIGHIAALASKPLEDKKRWMDVFRRYAQLASLLVSQYTDEGVAGDSLDHLPSTLAALKDPPHLDSHSGLPNREYFETRGASVFKQAQVLQKNVNVLYFVLDDSDSHISSSGAIVGNSIAREFGNILRQAVGPHQGSSARTASRQFAVLLPIVDPQVAKDLMQEIAATLKAVCHNELRIMAPVGIGAGHTCIRETDPTFGVVMRRAQMAIFQREDCSHDRVSMLVEGNSYDLTSELRVCIGGAI